MQEQTFTGVLHFHAFSSSRVVLDNGAEVPLGHLFDSLFERLDGRPSKHTYPEGLSPTAGFVVDKSSIYDFDRESGWLVEREHERRKTYNLWEILRNDFSLRNKKRVTVTFSQEGVTVEGAYT